MPSRPDRPESALRVSGLYVYPIKSLGGIAVPSAEVEPRGFRFDRRFMVVDEKREFVTQRALARMARLRVAIERDRLRVEAPGSPPLEVALDADGARVDVRVWKDTVPAIDVGARAAAWLAQALGRPLSLVRMPEETRRPVDAEYAAPGDVVSFADAFPYLVTTTASLDDLNRRLPAPIPMDRFRPSIVVDGAAPFAEDDWRDLRIGGVPFALVKPCARCAVPSVDQETGEPGLDPLPVLARYRKIDGRVLFGQNAIARATGTVRVGDAVVVERRGP